MVEQWQEYLYAIGNTVNQNVDILQMISSNVFSW